MAVKCRRLDCVLNDGGWCSSYMIEIDENGRCLDFTPRRNKK